MSEPAPAPHGDGRGHGEGGASGSESAGHSGRDRSRDPDRDQHGGAALPTESTSASPVELQLRCRWDGCEFHCHISQVGEWRKHWACGIVSHRQQQERGQQERSGGNLRCCFPACAESHRLFSGIEEALAHEDSCHACWVCCSGDGGCGMTFGRWRRAALHVLRHHHHHHQVDDSSLGKVWIANPPSGFINGRSGEDDVDPVEEFGSDLLSRCVDVSPTNNTAASKSLNESVMRLVTAQLASLQTLVAAHPEISNNNSERSRWCPQESLDAIRAGILPGEQSSPVRSAVVFPTSTAPAPTTEEQSSSRAHNAIASAPPPTPNATEPPTPPFHQHCLFREATWPPQAASHQSGRQSELQREHCQHRHPQQQEQQGQEQPERPRRHQRTPSGRLEPLQDVHIPLERQKEYFARMQDCCVEAAYTFYARHRDHLDKALNNRRQPLCRTSRQNRIVQKDDLTLPQWTHLLRRLADSRSIEREMVSRLESFSGEIQPVDEVRHAHVKNKEKSDRDLLALVQTTRCFCWQLRDWEKCEQLDDLYGVIKEIIEITSSGEGEGIESSEEGWSVMGSPPLSNRHTV